jgi:C4-type Zn-finger protein
MKHDIANDICPVCGAKMTADYELWSEIGMWERVSPYRCEKCGYDEVQR